MKRVSILLLVLAFGLGAAAVLMQREPAAAAGPCNVGGSELDSEETQFLGLLQQWRNSTLRYSSPLEVSGALNQAAAWFAEWQVNHGTPGGHNDDSLPGGRYFNQRAMDCGYTGSVGGQPISNGTGEGVFGVSSSGAAGVGPTQAMAGITYGGSGVYIQTNSTSLPAKCVGVAVKRNAAGTAVAWVVVIGQYPASSPCPGGSGGGTATTAATSTPTKTPTPTPTPSPTPTPRADGVAVTIVAGWNLVVIPSGPIDDVLYRAKGCYRSVYQQDGDRWLRYSPDAPPYANNLRTSNGGVFWVEGTAANCGPVRL
ncbi:MAG: hypothetical protein C0506_08795 [Anaerolinea sp.]|nr:hypothetical protein [Anaerolinea sp.]